MLTSRAEPAKEHWARPTRTGRQYAEGLREQRHEVWLRGERVKHVTTQPGLAGGHGLGVFERAAIVEVRGDMHSSLSFLAMAVF